MRRLRKLAPTYFVFIFLWLIFKALLHSFSLQMAIGNILGIQNLTGLGQDFNWYISALIVFYILAPYLKITVDRLSPWGHLLFLLFLLILSTAFWGANTYIISVARLPVFYLGMIFAQTSCHNTQINKKGLAIMGMQCFSGFFLLLMAYQFAPHLLWSHGLHWYPFILITPPLCVALSLLSQSCKNIKGISLVPTTLSLIGNYSFEIYLLHIPLFQVLPLIIAQYGLQNYSWLVWTIGVVALVIGCRVLRFISQYFASLIRRARFTLGGSISKNL